MDSFTESTTQSWGSRIGGSFKGILFGILLIIISIPLLWWNEGRTVERYRALEEGRGQVMSVGSDSVDPANDGKLIHTSGTATTEETLSDTEFGISKQALQLRRQVEMYQWKETKKTKKEKNLGGSETTKTTYSYSREWSSSHIDSGSFRKSEGHKNPASMPYESNSTTTTQARLGAFRLSQSQVNRLSHYEDIPLQGMAFNQLQQPHQIRGNEIYMGEDPNSPQVGDTRIRFQQMTSAPMSIVARQANGGFAEFQASNGGTILLIENGQQTAEQMFQSAQQTNTLIAWGVRIGGFLLMFIGFRLVLAPLSVLADVVPFIGNIIGFGTGMIAFLIALPLSLIIIALAWVFYRPLLAGGILVVAIGSLVLPWWMKRGKKSTSAMPPPIPPAGPPQG